MGLASGVAQVRRQLRTFSAPPVMEDRRTLQSSPSSGWRIHPEMRQERQYIQLASRSTPKSDSGHSFLRHSREMCIARFASFDNARMSTGAAALADVFALGELAFHLIVYPRRISVQKRRFVPQRRRSSKDLR
ncbi:hypothetical protein BD410DRAFT_794987 [Rickenella mellea]|uniref:Uncharacterized protein n=1 Tax=Rickenella mellea TaxID=50990 RepID=A0A4Y7PQE1_9AGAM|nr:hypothetical protein BD410DRAFT_794987 [Rickenella mellea]